jgi:hypothetical protein
MANELIGFDVKAASKKVKQVAKIPFDTRKKVVIAAVRGMGGGKTRALSELRNVFMKEDGALMIAITYNNKMDLSGLELIVSPDSDIKFILTVVSRIISLLYGMPLLEVVELISNTIYLLPTHNLTTAIQILRIFIKRIVEAVRVHRNISTLVVAVDEISRIDDAMKKFYPVLANTYDFGGCLRKALLDPYDDNYDFDVALILAGLTVSPLEITFSNRLVTPLRLPGHLDPDLIVSKWWNTAHYSPGEKLLLRFIAESLSDSPRAVEFAADFVKDHAAHPVNQTYMADFIDYITEALNDNYLISYFPGYVLLYNIIFGYPVVADGEVMECIRRNILTNVFKAFGDNSTLTPSANIYMLGNAATQLPGENTESFSEAFGDIMSIVRNIKPGGFILEDYFRVWLKLRLKVAQNCPQFPLTLGNLLGIKTRLSGVREVELLDEIFDVSVYDFDQCFKGPLQYSTYEDEEGFIDEINKMDKNEYRQSAEGDALDGILNFVAKSTNIVKIIFDQKSPLVPSRKIPETNQYLRMKEIFDRRKIPFLYVYFTTYGGKTEFVDHDCLVINIKEARIFFGPIWSIFNFCRSSLDEKRST